MALPDPEGARDEVDKIVLAWQRERPDLDVRPLTVLSRVSRLARHLDLARRSAFARHDLETWEFDVLSALRRAGREPVGGTRAPQGGQHVELPRLEVVPRERRAAGEVEVPSQPADA